MRVRHHLLLLLALQPVAAIAAAPACYGPMKAWHGIGNTFGYEDRLEKDGSWRVTATTQGADAVDMALYRAAERARDMGYAYVEMLGGTATRRSGINAATVYTRLSQSAAAPTTCRSSRRGSCYTADVAAVLATLGRADGMRPGVAIVDHHDQFGRAVTVSGYGTGAAASAAPPMAIVPAPRMIVPMPVAAPPMAAARTTATRAPSPGATPPQQRPAGQGWTISD